jgi:hypothetical protein
MSDVELIPVSKGADYLEVHPTTLAGHKAVGWTECAKREAEEPTDGSSPVTAADLKAALTAKGIAFKGNASKADLQALLDGAPAA